MEKNVLFEKLSSEDRNEIQLMVESQIEKLSVSETERQILINEADRLGIDSDKLMDYVNGCIEQKLRVISVTETKEKSLRDFIVSSLSDDVISGAERKVIYAKARLLGYSTEEADAMIQYEQDEKERAKNKFWYAIKKHTGIEKMEFIGLCFALIAFIMTLSGYKYQETTSRFLGIGSKQVTIAISASENLTWATVVSFILVGFLYLRKLMTFANSNKMGQWISIVINVCMFAGVIALFGDAIKEVLNPEPVDKGLLLFSGRTVLFYCVLVFILTMLFFGQRGLAKVVFFIGVITILVSAVLNISEALSVFGMFLIVFIFSSLFFQENIKFKEIAHEISILYGTGSRVLAGAMMEATDEIEHAGNVSMSMAKTAIKSAMAAEGLPPSMIDAASIDNQMGSGDSRAEN